MVGKGINEEKQVKGTKQDYGKRWQILDPAVKEAFIPCQSYLGSIPVPNNSFL